MSRFAIDDLVPKSEFNYYKEVGNDIFLYTDSLTIVVNKKPFPEYHF